MIQLKGPQDSLFYTFEWADAIPEGIQLVGVVHNVPAPLNRIEQDVDTLGQLSTVKIDGGVHGGLYQVTALATLSNGESVSAGFTVRVIADV